MNDPHDRRAQLLAETLHGDWAGGPASAMARRAAALARRRRRLKHTAVTLAAAVALAAVMLVGNRARWPLAAPRTPAAVVPRGYEIISDDELVALLRDRPLLVLPQEDGSKKLVLLDR